MNAMRWLALATIGSALMGCGSVALAPEPTIPTALVTQMPVRVALVLTPEQLNYLHSETRQGATWEVRLGPGHGLFARKLFTAMFREYEIIPNLDAARTAQPPFAAIFEPRMEQYSFATASETAGDYYAVTIQYRVNVYSTTAELADSYTITGYGNSRDQTMSSSKPLDLATRAAMRDAAAKFLVQFPEQPLGQQLAKGQPVTTGAALANASPGQAIPMPDDASEIIEAVPIVGPDGS